MNVVCITEENFEFYNGMDVPLVVDFWAEWCGPCKTVAPILSSIANDLDGKVVVGKCNVEQSGSLATKFGIRNVPTILFFKEGKVVDKLVGGVSRVKIQEKFEQILNG